MNGVEVIIHDVIEVDNFNIINRDVGKVIALEEKLPIVVCGSGLLKIISAFYPTHNSSILPLQIFRSRFKGINNI